MAVSLLDRAALHQALRRLVGRLPTKHFKQISSNLLRNESGQDLIEYALVAAVIALGAVVAMSTLAVTIRTTFNTVGTKITAAV
jgi:pilus assembly protein Flp/PilA